MAYQAISIKCPNCATPVSIDDPVCPSCGTKVLISNYDTFVRMDQFEAGRFASSYHESLTEHPENGPLIRSASMCFMRLRLYDQAIQALERSMAADPSNAETYFYAAICLLKGTRPFLAVKPVIDRVEAYVNAALMLQPRGIYYYFLSYVKYDYFFLNHLRTSPTWQQALQSALNAGLTTYEVEQLYEMLGTEKPPCL